MSYDKDVHAWQIGRALQRRYQRDSYGYFQEVPVGLDVNGNLRFDGIVMKRAGQNLYFEGFEVKISRSDFLRDVKYHLYSRYVNSMTMACPKNMIGLDEIPDSFGLLYYTRDAKDPENGIGQLRWKRKPVWDESADTRALANSLLSRLAWKSSTSRRPDRYESAMELLSEREAMKTVGGRLGTRMAHELEMLQRKVESNRLKADGETKRSLDRLLDLLEKNGFNIPWNRTMCEEDWQRLETQLSDIIPHDRFERNIKNAISDLKTLIREESLK